MTSLGPMLDSAMAQLGGAWLISTLLPSVFGGVLVVFKPWIPGLRETRQRVDRVRNQIVEQCCNAEHRMLAKAIQIGLTSMDVAKLSELRGNGRDEPDLIQQHVSELLADAIRLDRLDAINRTVRSLHHAILTGLVGAVAAVLVAGLVERGRPIIGALGLFLLIVQIICVVRLCRLENELDSNEQKA